MFNIKISIIPFLFNLIFALIFINLYHLMSYFIFIHLYTIIIESLIFPIIALNSKICIFYFITSSPHCCITQSCASCKISPSCPRLIVRSCFCMYPEETQIRSIMILHTHSFYYLLSFCGFSCIPHT